MRRELIKAGIVLCMLVSIVILQLTVMDAQKCIATQAQTIKLLREQRDHAMRNEQDMENAFNRLRTAFTTMEEINAKNEGNVRACTADLRRSTDAINRYLAEAPR
jgi:cell division protein FtsL